MMLCVLLCEVSLLDQLGQYSVESTSPIGTRMVPVPGTRTVLVPGTRTVLVPGTRTVPVPGTRTVPVPQV